MFISTIRHSARRPSIEPTAICNYATFLFKQKRDVGQARRFFQLGLQRFPKHRGLQRNYRAILKERPAPPTYYIIEEDRLRQKLVTSDVLLSDNL
jgi:hypothetical protein